MSEHTAEKDARQSVTEAEWSREHEGENFDPYVFPIDYDPDVPPPPGADDEDALCRACGEPSAVCRPACGRWGQ